MIYRLKFNIKHNYQLYLNNLTKCRQCYSTTPKPAINRENSSVEINNKKYEIDQWTNVTPTILSYMGRNIYLQKHHPISIVRQQIINYFYKIFVNNKGNPLFSVYDNLCPVVTQQQNFDNLLIPKDHPSRAKSDCYYVNKNVLLRAHTTAHQVHIDIMLHCFKFFFLNYVVSLKFQVDLLKSGLDNYLTVGEVYRRDEIDATHFPVFHQLDAVRTLHRDKLFKNNPDLEIFETSYKTNPSSFMPIKSSIKCIDQSKQPCHTLEAVKLMEHEFKTVLVGLAKHLFGKDIEYRWVSQWPNVGILYNAY